MSKLQEEIAKRFYNKPEVSGLFSAPKEAKQKTQYEKDIESGIVNPEFEPKSDGRNLKEYLQYSLDNKDMLEKSFFIAVQILDALDKQGKTKEDLATLLGITIEEVKTYFTGEYDFDSNLELKEKIKNILNIKLV